jgi:hypothetical protein
MTEPSMGVVAGVIANTPGMPFTHAGNSMEDLVMKRGLNVTLALVALGILSVGPALALSPIEVPEPTSLALIAVGIGALAIFRARRGR